MTRVTVWYCQNKDGSWSHNHIIEGWAIDLEMPTAINEHQKATWKSKRWKAVYAWRSNNGVVSENAFMIAPLLDFPVYDGIPVPSSLFVERMEEHRRCPYFEMEGLQ